MIQPEFDFTRSAERRDAGIASVVASNPDWHRRALRAIAALPCGWMGLGEDIRAAVLADGIDPPPRPHAWGGLIQAAKKFGLIEPTGVRRSMRDVKSHARVTDEYVRAAKSFSGDQT